MADDGAVKSAVAAPDVDVSGGAKDPIRQLQNDIDEDAKKGHKSRPSMHNIRDSLKLGGMDGSFDRYKVNKHLPQNTMFISPPAQ